VCRVAIAEPAGNLVERRLRRFEQASGQVEANLIDELLVREVDPGEPALEESSSLAMRSAITDRTASTTALRARISSTIGALYQLGSSEDCHKATRAVDPVSQGHLYAAALGQHGTTVGQVSSYGKTSKAPISRFPEFKLIPG
jgi:hypothetical protein